MTLLIEIMLNEIMKDIFDDVGLSDMMYVHEMNTEWPTLIEMINMEKRRLYFGNNLVIPLTLTTTF